MDLFLCRLHLDTLLNVFGQLRSQVASASNCCCRRRRDDSIIYDSANWPIVENRLLFYITLSNKDSMHVFHDQSVYLPPSHTFERTYCFPLTRLNTLYFFSEARGTYSSPICMILAVLAHWSLMLPISAVTAGTKTEEAGRRVV